MGTWGYRSYDSDDVWDALHFVYNHKPVIGPLNRLLGGYPETFPRFYKHPRIFFGVVVKLFDHCKLSRKVVGRALAIGKILMRQVGEEGWRDPRERRKVLGRELKILSYCGKTRRKR